MRHAEAVIVGGGPAGAATACCLAASGGDVMLIERSGAPHHKVCGEFLSIDTQKKLHALGIDAAALGAASIDHLTLYCGAQVIRTRLPFRALSISRFQLDAALLRRAEECGAQVLRNVVARRVEQISNGWTVHLSNGGVIVCRHLVSATGKWGLRGISDNRDNSRVGLKIHLRLSEDATRALTGCVNLHFLDHGYAGLELIEDGTANLCVLVDQKAAPLRGVSWIAIRDYLAAAQPRLGDLLASSEPLWDKPIAVVCPSGGYLHCEDNPAIYRVGDRLTHIPPFSGDGLSIALGTGELAAISIREGYSPMQYLAAARRLITAPVRFASGLSFLSSHKLIRAVLLRATAHSPRLIDAIVHRTRINR